MKKIIFLLFLAISICSCAQKGSIKKPVPPAKAPVKTLSGPEASIIAFTIEHNGEKTPINNKQFETWGGTTIPNGMGNSIILNYGASNSKKNQDSFNWMFTIPDAAKGNYVVGERNGSGPGTSLQFSTTAFPDIPIFICKSGFIVIEDCPLPGGFVKGSFTVVLTGGVKEDGTLDESLYTISGSFSIFRQ